MTIMKTIDFRKVWIGLMILPLVLVSCDEDILPGISGEGEIVTRNLMLDEFTGFSNTIAADVFITESLQAAVPLLGTLLKAKPVIMADPVSL